MIIKCTGVATLHQMIYSGSVPEVVILCRSLSLICADCGCLRPGGPRMCRLPATEAEGVRPQAVPCRNA